MRAGVIAAAILGAFLLAGGAATAADPPAGEGASSTPVPAPPAVAPEDAATIEKILRERDQLIMGTHFTYDPGGRRDPFRSLIEEVRRQKAMRPKGIRGMSISEVDLVGVVAQPGNPLALFSGSDGKGYTLRVGDELFDGRVLSIDPARGTVTFRQQVDDPRQIKPYREVVKRLVPLAQEEEGL